MTMRKWQEHFTEILEVLSDGEVWKRMDLIEAVSHKLELTEEERKTRISSGGLMYVGRIGFAISHLKRVGAIASPARAQFRILEAGRQLLAAHPGAVTMEVVQSALGDPDKPEKKPEGSATVEVTEAEQELVPVEQIAAGIERNNKLVVAELLTRLHANTPAFFEQAVLDVLMAMGYGGTDGKATRTKLSNDGGIDGVIDQDALGLSRIYVQAKRFDPGSTIQRPEIQKFVGALQGVQADRGVFLTTAKYSSGAIAYAEGVQSRVILIDGQRLAELMLRYGVGVQVKKRIEVVEVDEDYFESVE